MTLYAIFKEAHYRHECGGIFSTLPKAKKAKAELKEKETDEHHKLVIVPFNLDEVAETYPYEYCVGQIWTQWKEADPIAETSGGPWDY